MCAAKNNDQDAIRKVAYAIYFESRENGLENDPLGDWFKAERICRSKTQWLLWQVLWHLKRYPSSITAVVAFIALFLNIFTTAWVVYTNNSSTDLANRAYVSVNMKDPVRFKQGQDVFYGNGVVLKNGGKTAASKVSTSYYITTDLDGNNMNGDRWFDEHLGGFGAVSFIAPGAEEIEPGFRSLSPAADYYYFEALTSYEGLQRGRSYWTHIRKIFFHHKPTGRLYPVFSQGEWDRNDNFNPPRLATTQEVIAMLESIKKRRRVNAVEDNKEQQAAR